MAHPTMVYRLSSTTHPTNRHLPPQRPLIVSTAAPRINTMQNNNGVQQWSRDAPLPPPQLNTLRGRKLLLENQTGRSDYFSIISKLQALEAIVVIDGALTSDIYAWVVNGDSDRRRAQSAASSQQHQSVTTKSMGNRMVAKAASQAVVAAANSPILQSPSASSHSEQSVGSQVTNASLALQLGVHTWSWKQLLAQIERILSSTVSERIDLPPCSLPRIIIEDKAKAYRPIMKVFEPMRTITSQKKGTTVMSLFPIHTAPIVDWRARGHASPFVRGEGNLRKDGAVQPTPITKKSSSKFCEICNVTFSGGEAEHLLTPRHYEQYINPAFWEGRKRLQEMVTSQRESDEQFAPVNRFPRKWTDAQCIEAQAVFFAQAHLLPTNAPIDWRAVMRDVPGFEAEAEEEEDAEMTDEQKQGEQDIAAIAIDDQPAAMEVDEEIPAAAASSSRASASSIALVAPKPIAPATLRGSARFPSRSPPSIFSPPGSSKEQAIDLAEDEAMPDASPEPAAAKTKGRSKAAISGPPLLETRLASSPSAQYQARGSKGTLTRSNAVDSVLPATKATSSAKKVSARSKGSQALDATVVETSQNISPSKRTRGGAVAVSPASRPNTPRTAKGKQSAAATTNAAASSAAKPNTPQSAKGTRKKNVSVENEATAASPLPLALASPVKLATRARTPTTSPQAAAVSKPPRAKSATQIRAPLGPQPEDSPAKSTRGRSASPAIDSNEQVEIRHSPVSSSKKRYGRSKRTTPQHPMLAAIKGSDRLDVNANEPQPGLAPASPAPASARAKTRAGGSSIQSALNEAATPIRNTRAAAASTAPKQSPGSQLRNALSQDFLQDPSIVSPPKRTPRKQLRDEVSHSFLQETANEADQVPAAASSQKKSAVRGKMSTKKASAPIAPAAPPQIASAAAAPQSTLMETDALPSVRTRNLKRKSTSLTEEAAANEISEPASAPQSKRGRAKGVAAVSSSNVRSTSTRSGKRQKLEREIADAPSDNDLQQEEAELADEDEDEDEDESETQPPARIGLHLAKTKDSNAFSVLFASSSKPIAAAASSPPITVSPPLHARSSSAGQTLEFDADLSIGVSAAPQNTRSSSRGSFVSPNRKRPTSSPQKKAETPIDRPASSTSRSTRASGQGKITKGDAQSNVIDLAVSASAQPSSAHKKQPVRRKLDTNLKPKALRDLEEYLSTASTANTNNPFQPAATGTTPRSAFAATVPVVRVSKSQRKAQNDVQMEDHSDPALLSPTKHTRLQSTQSPSAAPSAETVPPAAAAASETFSPTRRGRADAPKTPVVPSASSSKKTSKPPTPAQLRRLRQEASNFTLVGLSAREQRQIAAQLEAAAAAAANARPKSGKKAAAAASTTPRSAEKISREMSNLNTTLTNPAIPHHSSPFASPSGQQFAAAAAQLVPMASPTIDQGRTNSRFLNTPGASPSTAPFVALSPTDTIFSSPPPIISKPNKKGRRTNFAHLRPELPPSSPEPPASSFAVAPTPSSISSKGKISRAILQLADYNTKNGIAWAAPPLDHMIPDVPPSGRKTAVGKLLARKSEGDDEDVAPMEEDSFATPNSNRPVRSKKPPRSFDEMDEEDSNHAPVSSTSTRATPNSINRKRKVTASGEEEEAGSQPKKPRPSPTAFPPSSLSALPTPPPLSSLSSLSSPSVNLKSPSPQRSKLITNAVHSGIETPLSANAAATPLPHAQQWMRDRNKLKGKRQGSKGTLKLETPVSQLPSSANHAREDDDDDDASMSIEESSSRTRSHRRGPSGANLTDVFNNAAMDETQ